MRRLTARAGGVAPRAAAEDGAVAILIALLLVVLVGMAAMAIDVGAMHAERRELQNGADAAALAVAQSCAGGDCDTSPYGDRWATADDFADANAADLAAQVTDVRVPGDGGAQTVTVDTASDPALPMRFARIFGITDTTVDASATATWYAPTSLAPTLPLTISICEWEASSSGVFPGAEIVLDFHRPNSGVGGGGPPPNLDEDYCPVGPAGMDSDGDGYVPGGFGWLDAACGMDVDPDGDGWVGDDNGNNPECRDELDVGATVLIPIFDEASCGPDPCATAGLGRIDQYHLMGYAAFEISGYWFPGEVDYSGTSRSCDPGEVCLIGRFVAYVELGDTYEVPGGGVDLGVSVVRLTD